MAKKPQIMTKEEFVEYIVNDRAGSGLSCRMYGKSIGIDGSYISGIVSGRVGVSAWVAWHYGYNTVNVFTEIGKKSRDFITADDMAGILRDTVNKSGLIAKDWSTKHGYVPSNVSNYMRGFRPVSESMARCLGYQKHTVYVLETDPNKIVKRKARGRVKGFKTRIGSEVTVNDVNPVAFW